MHLLLSGPAGGLAAAAHIGRELDCKRLLTFDMGGTSTDVALLDGKPSLTRDGRIGRYPVAVPMVDMHTIGAGGGSIARVDAGGLIQVGPESAGADPGPVCYGRGGQENVTVTDANLLLGRLPRETRLGGTHRLDYAALTGHGCAGETRGTLARRNRQRRAPDRQRAHEPGARVMSAERGVDPKSATLMSFGGAGGLHVCELAESLGMTRAIVPARSGVLSALGMLVARPGRQATGSFLRARTRFRTTTSNKAWNRWWVRRAMNSATRESRPGTSISNAGSIVVTWDRALPWSCRSRRPRPWSRRSTTCMNKPSGIGWNCRWRLSACGWKRAACRASAAFPRWQRATDDFPAYQHEVPVRSRDGLKDRGVDGPAIVVDADATTWVAEGWTATLDGGGHVMLQSD